MTRLELYVIKSFTEASIKVRNASFIRVCFDGDNGVVDDYGVTRAEYIDLLITAVVTTMTQTSHPM